MMTWTRRGLLIGAGGAAIAASLPAMAAPARIVAGPAFGTAWRIALPNSADGTAVKAAVAAIVTSIDNALSPFRPSTEISRFNAATTTDWHPLSADGAVVVAEGLRIARLTDGAFDPTVGGIVGRYGFGPIRQSVPATYTDLASHAGAARKSKPGVTFDPCGIAKGYALDLMAARLGGLGVADFLIELGGEVFGRGMHPGGRSWQVGIERPVAGDVSFQRIVRLDGQAVATSANTVNGYEFAGRRYSHIIDPRTGEPVVNGLASVSVIASTGMVADALATALMAMGPEVAAEFAERLSLAALFVVRDGDRLRAIETARFAPYIVA